MRLSVSAITKALEDAGHIVEQGRTNCPAHKGENNNLSVFEREDGTGGDVFCHSEECTREAILRAIYLWVEKKPEPGTRKYKLYSDGVYLGDKTVVRHPDGSKKVWLPTGTKPLELDLYRSWELNGSGTAVVVEGERAADQLREYGYAAVATQSAGAIPPPSKLKVLDGREVILWPDNDPQGIEHMARFAKALGRPVKVVDVSNVPVPKWDAGDASKALVGVMLDGAKDYVPEAPASQPKVCTVDDFLAQEFPPERWRVDKLIQTIGNGFIVGPRKHGKTLMAMQLAWCVAAGKPFLGFEVEQAPVLLIEEEGGSGFYQDHLISQRDGLGLGKGLPLFVAHRQKFRLDRPESVDFLRGQIDATGAKLILMGTMNKLVSFKDSHRGEEWNDLGVTTNDLATDLGCMVVPLHHSRKDVKPRTVDEAYDIALGSTQVGGNVDCLLTIYRQIGEPTGIMFYGGRDGGGGQIGIRFDESTLLISRDDDALQFGKAKQLGGLASWLWSRDDWATPDEIRKGTEIPKTTLDRLLDEMEAKGDVVKEISSGRGRQRRYRMAARDAESLAADFV